MAGLTATGITIKDVDEIVADMASAQVANIDADLHTESDSVLGQLNGVYGAALAELWELLEQVYQAAYPDTASGQSLSYVSALTGAIRQVATKAELEVRLTGVVTTVVPAGTQFYPDGDADSLFQTTADATIQEHGTPDYEDVTAQAVNTGSGTTVGETDDLVIATPVSGLTLIAIDTTNPFAEAFLTGTDEETDSELRVRREESLALAGASTVEAIRAEMLQITGVDSCTVFENPTSETDALLLPPKSIEVLVFSETAPDFDSQEVADEILLRKPAGTQTFGGIGPTTATDSAGNSYDIYYSEPATIQAWVELDLTAATDGSYGTGGDDRVIEAIADWATQSLRVGQSLYSSDIVSVATDVEGVVSVDVLNTFVDDTSSPNEYEVTATGRDLITVDSGDVTVNS